ncbi:MAG TPA: energy transducer TonB [Solimonas sp.]
MSTKVHTSPLRFAKPLVIGLAVTFTMFATLQLMIQGGRYHAGETQTLATIDFVRLKRTTELETRQRQKPEKPPPPKQPPPPQLKVQAASKADVAPVKFTVPNLNLGTNISGGPFLGSFSAAGPIAGDGELIAMVRIAPQYPRQAALDGVSGEVLLEITVGPDGTVKSARVKSAKPRGYFESAAVAAAYKGRFRPKVVDGKPVETKGEYTVKFNMGAD